MTRSGDKIEIAQVVLKLVFIYKIENKIRFHRDSELLSTTQSQECKTLMSVWENCLTVKEEAQKFQSINAISIIFYSSSFPSSHGQNQLPGGKET